MAITTRKMTLEEFLKLPEEEPALELIEGMVSQKVSPKFRHGRLQSKATERINLFAEPRELAMAVSEVRTTFGGHSPVPDVSVYRWERIPRDEHGNVVDETTEPPDIAIEIASPEQSLKSLMDKCRWLANNGVAIVLLLDPDTETVWDCRAGAEPRILRGDDVIDWQSVLPGLRVTVRELFAPLHPSGRA